MKLMKKAVPQTRTGSSKELSSICLIHSLPGFTTSKTTVNDHAVSTFQQTSSYNYDTSTAKVCPLLSFTSIPHQCCLQTKSGNNFNWKALSEFQLSPRIVTFYSWLSTGSAVVNNNLKTSWT